jgi:glycerol kinase
VGTWSSQDEIAEAWRCARRYEPVMAREEAERLLAEWRLAVRRVLLS